MKTASPCTARVPWSHRTAPHAHDDWLAEPVARALTLRAVSILGIATRTKDVSQIWNGLLCSGQATRKVDVRRSRKLFNPAQEEYLPASLMAQRTGSGAVTCVTFFLLVGLLSTATTSATSQTNPLDKGAWTTLVAPRDDAGLPDPTIIKLVAHLDQFMQVRSDPSFISLPSPRSCLQAWLIAVTERCADRYGQRGRPCAGQQGR
jgi:hypothetical protein